MNNRMTYLLDIVENCRDVTQQEIYHPEGNVLNHLLQTFKWACRESNDYDLRLAALLHDVGKQVTRLGHNHESVKLIEGFVSKKTLWLVDQHMRVWTFLTGEMKKLKKTQTFFNHIWFKDLTFLARWDSLGRNKNIKLEFNREKIITQLKEKL